MAGTFPIRLRTAILGFDDESGKKERKNRSRERLLVWNQLRWRSDEVGRQHKLWLQPSPDEQRRQWHPTPVLLPGKSHGQRSLVGWSPWGRWGLDMIKWLHFHFHALEKEMATHSSVLAWRIPGTGEPGGLPSMGSHRVGHDWSDLTAAAVPMKVYTANHWGRIVVQGNRDPQKPGHKGQEELPVSGLSVVETDLNTILHALLSLPRLEKNIHEKKDASGSILCAC